MHASPEINSHEITTKTNIHIHVVGLCWYMIKGTVPNFKGDFSDFHHFIERHKGFNRFT